MSYLFTVSPDFTPDHLPGWYIFNTWLQRQTGESIHLEMYDDYDSQRIAIGKDKIDLIYANPYDATVLIRDNGFLPLVKPVGISDEVILAVSADSVVDDIGLLPDKIKVATTDDPEVQMIGMILLEPRELELGDIGLRSVSTNILAAKEVMQKTCDVGFFPADVFDDLSEIVKKQLKVVVRSEISVIHHSLMIGPKLVARRDEFRKILLNMNADPKSKGVLDSLGFSGWEVYGKEEAEFMIDLMDALLV